MKNEDDIVQFLSNRQKTLLPRKTKFYCPRCDAGFVRPGGKCNNCGKRSIGRLRWQQLVNRRLSQLISNF